MMKNLLIATLVAAGALASPASILVATNATAIECAPGVPEGYQRPGGYCDQIGSMNTLASTGTGSPPAPAQVIILDKGCNIGGNAFLKLPLLEGERLHVAAGEIEDDCIR